MQTIQEATEYLIKNIESMDPENTNIDPDTVEMILEEKIIEQVEDKLDDNETDLLDEKIGETEWFESYIKNKTSNYGEVLESSVREILEEYLVEELIPLGSTT